MRYFLIILLGSISFLSPAQDVVVPADVARHFLEQDDRVKLLAKKDSVNVGVISGIKEELRIRQSIIDHYRDDSITFRSKLSNKDEQISLVKEELVSSQKLINTQKFEVNLFAGATAGVIIGSAIPVIGTIGGGAIGAITGCVVYGIHKIKQLFKR